MKILQPRFALRTSATRLLTAVWMIQMLVFLNSIAGCGTPGAPSAPSLKLPDPVTDLVTTRMGNQVTLKWTMPKRSTDKLLLVGGQKARILRALGPASAQPAAELTFNPGIEVSYIDKLPQDLASEPLRLLTYRVELLNHASQSAGFSNVAYSAAGAAPAPLTGLTAAMQPQGVVLHWTALAAKHAETAHADLSGHAEVAGAATPPGADAAETSIRILRRLEGGTATPRTAIPRTATPRTATPEGDAVHPLRTSPKKANAFKQADREIDEQSLMVKEPTRPLEAATRRSALDTSASFDRKYTYVAERVFLATLEGHSIEIAGHASAPVVVDTKDIFPPTAPEGLAAIAVPEQSAIDLSWAPSLEADLAGYTVYRREGQGAWVRISPDGAVLAPEFRDNSITHHHSYSYAVTAVDRSSNESPRSTTVEETLP